MTYKPENDKGIEGLIGYYASNYDHNTVVDKLCTASYCSKGLRRKLRETHSKEELNQLGYTILDNNPRAAHDIFIYTADPSGRHLTREKLYNSDDPHMRTYAFFASFEEGPEYARQFGETLLEKRDAPYLAFVLFEKLVDLASLTRALEQLKESDPELAEELERKRFKDVKRKTPAPHELEAVRE